MVRCSSKTNELREKDSIGCRARNTTIKKWEIDAFFTAVRHEVNNLESSVVVQELEPAINLALWGFYGV